MSAVTPSFETRKRVRRTRDGEASVLTDELLSAIAEAVKGNKDPDALIVLTTHPRNTPGSAAGFGHQIRLRLAKAPYNLKVHSSPVPVNEEAWAKLDEKVQQKSSLATTDAQKNAIKHYAAFYPYKPGE